MYPIICAPDNEFPFVITPTVCHCCARWDCVMGSRMWCTIRRNQWAPAKTCKQCVKVQLQTVLLKCYRRLLLFFIQADPRAYYYLTKLHIKQTSVLCFAPYLSLAPHPRCVKLQWTRWPWASPVYGTSSLSRRGSTFQRHRWAKRCSSCLSPLFVLTSLCTWGIWTGGSPPRTSGRTCDRTTWSPARTSGRDRADTPADPWWVGYVTRTTSHGKSCSFFFVKAMRTERLLCVRVLHWPFK